MLSEYCLFDNLRVILDGANDSVKKHFDAELLPFGKNKKVSVTKLHSRKLNRYQFQTIQLVLIREQH